SGTIGPPFRPENGVGGPNGALTVGNELRWSFGAYLPMRGGRARLGGELFGSTGLLSSAGPNDENTVFGARNTLIEWLGQFRFPIGPGDSFYVNRSEEHTSELQSRENLVCRLLLEKKKMVSYIIT